MKKLSMAIFIMAFSICSNAQDFGISTMNKVWQKSNNNPSHFNGESFMIALPSANFNLSTGQLTYNNIMGKNKLNETVIDAEKLIANASNQNHLYGAISGDLYAIAFSSPKWQVHLSQSIKNQTAITIPKTLLQAAFQGNGQFIGQNINIAPQINSTLYKEFALGFTWKFEKLSIGLRGKWLQGIFNISTINNQLYLSTSEKHHLTLESDYTINTAGIGISGLENLENEDLDIQGMDEFTDLYESAGKNKGLAVDFGATFYVNEKLTVSGSIIDLGKINWKQNVNNHTSNSSYTFSGLDIANIVENDKIDTDLLQDSIVNTLNFKKNTDNFSTKLNARTYWTVDYKLSQRFNIGGLVHTLHIGKQVHPIAALNGSVNFGKVLSLGTVLSYGTNTNFSVGGNMVLRVGPLRIFSAVDNMLALANVQNQRFTHARIGINLTFDRRDSPEENVE